MLTLKAPITTVADDKIATTFSIFDKNKVWYYMRIVCQQTILMKYHGLFIIFEKNGKICNRHLLLIIGGALRVKPMLVFFQQGYGTQFVPRSCWSL